MSEPVTLDLTFSVPVEAADKGRRTITGTVVPYGAVGETSVGPTVFTPGAFGQLDADAVALVREHDETTPLGRATSLTDDGERIVGTFRLANTTAGSDALVEAAEGLRAGLSVGARATAYDRDDEGRLLVTAAELRHVGLVVRPAYAGSTVAAVAAAHRDPETPTPTPNADELECTMPETTDTTPSVDAGEHLTIDHVQQAITAALDQRDEAALELNANNPPTERTPNVEVNEPDITAAEYARAVVLADRGDQDAADLITAAVATVGTTTHTGVVPEPMLQDWIGKTKGNRPTVQAMTSRQLPEAGMKFELPRWVTTPQTGETAEGVEIVSQATEIDEMQVDVVKIAGGNRVSVELIERSSPAYLEELIDELVKDFRRRSNAYAHAQLIANVGTNVSDGETLHKGLARAKGDVFGAFDELPDRALSGVDRFVEIDGAEDASGRPLYTALAPQNAPGRLDGAMGILSGLGYSLDGAASAASLYAFASDATRYYEQPGAPFRVQMLQVSTMEWEVAVYGFLAAAVKNAGAVREVTVTEPA